MQGAVNPFTCGDLLCPLLDPDSGICSDNAGEMKPYEVIPLHLLWDQHRLEPLTSDNKRFCVGKRPRLYFSFNRE